MKKVKIWLLQSSVSLIPGIYLMSIWNSLPEIIPTHFNGQFEADRFGSKTEILTVTLIMALISVLVSLLILNIDKIDPKKQYRGTNNLLVWLSWTIVVFISVLLCIIVYATAHYAHDKPGSHISKYIIALVALLFAAMGLILKNLKPNYFIGIRTPWTLEDEDNWRKTHLLGAKIWLYGGLIAFILVILSPGSYAHLILIFTAVPMALIPIGYSYHLFSIKQKLENLGS
jgi:uncharacterized membrane protein